MILFTKAILLLLWTWLPKPTLEHFENEKLGHFCKSNFYDFNQMSNELRLSNICEQRKELETHCELNYMNF